MEIDFQAYCCGHALKGFQEGVVADHPAQHVEHHSAFVEHDGVVLGRELVQVRRLGDGRHVFVGEGADLDIVHGVFKDRFVPPISSHTERRGVSGQALIQESVVRRCGAHKAAPPLV